MLVIQRNRTFVSRKKGRVLRPKTTKRGYSIVTLCVDGRKLTTGVHRLVCEAFHGIAPENKPFTAHGDGNPSNNRPKNLRWATSAENHSDMIIHGTILSRARNPRAKLTEENVTEIRASRGVARRDLAARYGVSESQIKNVQIGNSWKESQQIETSYLRNWHNTRLTEAQAREAKYSDEPPSVIALRLGVGRSTIRAIREGRTWKGV